MLLDISPLKNNRPFRFLYINAMLCIFAAQIYLVALPFQIYHLTNSTLLVGLLSLCELVPMVLMGLLGGAFADRFDRKKILMLTGLLSAVGSLLLLWNASLAHPHIVPLFLIGFLMSAAGGLGRPAAGALTQAVIGRGNFKAVSSLTSFGYSFTSIVGPALTGLFIAHFGFPCVFIINFCFYIIGIGVLFRLSITHKVEVAAEKMKVMASIRQGLHYAVKSQELMGSYIVDIVAMIFGMPNALFPALAQHLGGASAVGFLYAAPSIGALVITLFSQWTQKVKAYGKAVIISALFWGIFIIFLGLTHSLLLAVIFLACAGAADAVSGIFRQTLWNETIPNHLRGRLAGIEMISYMSGPALGNAEAGLVASAFGVAASVISGGVICVIGVAVCIKYFPKFWKYQADVRSDHMD